MNRRDFFLLRTNKPRVVELSCQRLYMRCLDVRTTQASREDSIARHCHENAWMGEPPAVFEMKTIEQLFQDLECGLQNADTLRIRDRQWNLPEEIAPHLEAVLVTFRRRGGRIEFVD